MTQPPAPTTGAYTLVNYEPTTDSFGNETRVAVLSIDGAPVVTLTQEVRGTERKHVASGVAVRERDPYGGYTRMDSAPASGAADFAAEPTVDEVAERAQAHVDTEDAYSFVKWADKGTPVPDGKSDAWHDARIAASKRFDRHVRNGKITGEKRTW